MKLSISIFAGLALIALAIYLKPLPGRYAPDQIDDEGIVILDTQTGKIHIHENAARVWFAIDTPQP